MAGFLVLLLFAVSFFAPPCAILLLFLPAFLMMLVVQGPLPSGAACMAGGKEEKNPFACVEWTIASHGEEWGSGEPMLRDGLAGEQDAQLPQGQIANPRERGGLASVPHPSCVTDSSLMGEAEYQALLETIGAVAFSFDMKTNMQCVSPYIGKMIAGNYDGRAVSDVMVEDHVIYPDDLEQSLEFRRQVQEGESSSMELRLKTPRGDYRWFRMALQPDPANPESGILGMLLDVDDTVKQREELLRQAKYDHISGLLNKEAFYQAGEQILAQHPKAHHYLIRMDVDRFKLINEMYSIPEGDKVLRYLGTTLNGLMEEGEVCARLGSDVYAACLARSEAGLLSFITSVEEAANRYPISFRFILSVGIVRIDGYHGESLVSLCDRAAMAQRTVKGNYVRRYAFYQESMSEQLSREHELIFHMDDALTNGEFCVYLQPQCEMSTHKMVGAEALVRWNRKEEGILAPKDFLPLFERNGFILRLDEYIWNETCKILRTWIDSGKKAVPISINVSRLHIQDEEFCEKLCSIVERNGVSPELLELEITESAYLDCPEMLYDVMEKLQKRGFKFSMDDFGSGYSSLNVLKDIPVDTVKIDLGFLRSARQGWSTGLNVLRGAIRLVQNLSLNMIVEGVETREQEDFLVDMDCMLAQGYYYSRPLPVKEFEKLYIDESKPEKADA